MYVLPSAVPAARGPAIASVCTAAACSGGGNTSARIAEYIASSCGCVSCPVSCLDAVFATQPVAAAAAAGKACMSLSSSQSQDVAQHIAFAVSRAQDCMWV
jgi:hypothetical protein